MAHITTLDELKQNITVLAGVEESDSLFISAYLNLENGQEDLFDFIENRARILRRILRDNNLADFEESLTKIRNWLDTELHPESLGVAIFLRGSHSDSFMLPMQFAAALPNLIALYPTPNIYHLVELKDNYHRYIVLFSLPNRASIVEVNLGASTTQAWLERTELRERVGSEWTRSHYQVHRSERGNRFLQEKLALLEKLMKAGGHTHLILAGDPGSTRRIQQALPDELAEKLVDVVPANERDQQTDVVLATLSSFIEHEERESQSIAEALVEGLRSQNLAVAGSAATLAALRWGDVDTLVMDSGYEPDPGWTCMVCQAMGTKPPRTTRCPQCSNRAVRPMDVKEALLRVAEQSGCPVEVVEQSSALRMLGGVGCLLRFVPDSENQASDAWQYRRAQSG